MTEIEDPWHSRPIDVHKWSDHPEVVQFVDRVWEQYLPKEVIGGRGPKPKMASSHGNFAPTRGHKT